METAVIRRASIEDVSQILALNESSDRLHMADYTDEYNEEELRFLVTDPRCLFLVAIPSSGFHDSKLIGYAFGTTITPLWFYFIEIIIEESARRMGLGQRLYGALRAECEKMGCAVVHGMVKDDENSTLGYWKTQGFDAHSKCIWVEDWIQVDETKE